MQGFSLEKRQKIIVVGGGIAGLTTAYRLQRGGMNVDLYEARGRVGGRILTVKVNHCIAELGAQNIADGGAAVHLNGLIDELGLRCVSSRVYLENLSYFNGRNIIPIHEISKDRKIDPEILKKELHQLASIHRNMKEILDKIVDPRDPLYDMLAVRMAAYEGGTVEQLSPLYTETLFHMLLDGISSVHPGNREGDTYVDLVTIDGGNISLPQKIGEALGSRLHLNMPLARVASSKNGSFRLTFRNGEEAEADILVLAIPCSVYEQIFFEEGMIPAQKLKDIRNIQYGANAKIMVPFTTTPSIIRVVGSEIVSFFDCAQQMLTLYYTGTTSLFSPETIASSYIQARPMIEVGFTNCPSFIAPVYAKDEANLSYDGPVGYSWPNDPYAKGTYSYVAIGQENVLTATVEENGEYFKALFAPIRKNLYFVGEHTSILSEVPGTMEAACESGERIARTILDFDQF